VKKRFTEEQIIGFLREVEAGMPVTEESRLNLVRNGGWLALSRSMA